jgi:hypothetical protein
MYNMKSSAHEKEYPPHKWNIEMIETFNFKRTLKTRGRSGCVHFATYSLLIGISNVYHEIVLFRKHGNSAYLVNTRDNTMEDAWTRSQSSTLIYLLEDVATGEISALLPNNRAVSFSNEPLYFYFDIIIGKRAIAANRC